MPADPGPLAYRPDPSRPARIMPWPQFQENIDILAGQVRDVGAIPDAIAGICSGGWITAQALADHFPGIPVLAAAAPQDVRPGGEVTTVLLASADGMLREARLQPATTLLLVDEIIDSGRTIGAIAAGIGRGFPGTRILLACLAADAAADPAPDFAARRMNGLPEFALPWRIQRDFAQTAACLLASGPLTTSEIDERLRDLGHDIPPHRLQALLSGLAASGRITAAGGTWAAPR